MDDKLKKSMTVDNLVGEEVTPEILESLVSEGRISFPYKKTNPSAYSSSEEAPDIPNIDTYLDSVKDNEEMVKQLEDIRDDLLKDMSIPPASDTIANAAKQLGSPDGSITKDIFDKAETILDPHVFIPNQLGQAPHIAALTGNGIIQGDFIDCNEVTKGIADNWKLTGNDESGATVDELHKKSAQKSVQDTKDAHNKKLTGMFKYILKLLWWNELWPRIVNFHLDILEKTMAKPTDTPFLIFRFFKKLTKPNYVKYGPIHRIINKLKIFLLCSLPKKAWKDYSPSKDIQVFFNNDFIALNDYCSRMNSVSECSSNDVEPKEFNSTDEGDVDGFPKDDAKDLQNKIKDKVNNAFGEGEKKCVSSNLEGIFSEADIPGPGLSPKCIEAAKTILDAVHDDAMSFTEYENSEDKANESLAYILQGNIKESQGDKNA